MDCDDIDVGCAGGWMLDAFRFTMKSGIIPWDAYPKGYMGGKTRCENSSVPANTPRFYNKNGWELDYVANWKMKELLTK